MLDEHYTRFIRNEEAIRVRLQRCQVPGHHGWSMASTGQGVELP